MGFADLFMRRQRHVQTLLSRYLQTWVACLEAFRDAWATYLTRGLGEVFDFKVAQTHKEESRADDLRRELELELYSKALLPEWRGDILGLLETVDRLLTEAEWVLYELQLQDLKIPAALGPDFDRLTQVVHECGLRLSEGLQRLLIEGRTEGVFALCEQVNTLESEADHLERALIRKIFRLEDLETAEKVMLKKLVRLLARVSDRAENVADRITLVSVKRRV